MSEQNVNPIPEGMHSLTPHLVCKDAVQAIEFYQKAFNAVEVMRLVSPTGMLVHGSVRIGDSMLMLAEENPQWGSLGPKSLHGSPVTIHLAVANVDAVFTQAVSAGAKILMPVSDMFWGDRYGHLEDPFGHKWAIATRIRNLTPAEMQAAASSMFK